MLQQLRKALAEHPGETAEELAQRLGLVPQQVRDGLAQLERMGYLVREVQAQHCVTGDQACHGCPFRKPCEATIPRLVRYRLRTAQERAQAQRALAMVQGRA
ncbi:MAG: hypothetical protein IMW91_00970 [Firmicutes bacterium]|nr:hypothetical protein [Bacillota bacterium]